MVDTEKNKPLTLFLSYSHKDEGLLDELKTHLSIMKRQGLLSTWHDRDIDAGQEWKSEIDAQLESADVILLLISPDLLNSDYCWNLEMMRAIERHDAGEARVVPIFLRHCDWHGAPFAKLQGLPADAKPIMGFGNRDEAFTLVAKGLRTLIEKFQRKVTAAQVSAVVVSPVEPSNIQEKPSAQTSSSLGIFKVIEDSGDLILLENHFLLAEKVDEGQSSAQAQSNLVTAWITPRSAEEEAHLRSFRADRNQARRPIIFAHRNEGFRARVISATSTSSSGKVLWHIDLVPAEDNQGAPMEIAFNGVSADQIAEMRARLILLNEQPGKGLGLNDLMVAATVSRHITGLELKQGIFPPLWKKHKLDDNFLEIARLWAVYCLKATGTCEHILELSLGPIEGVELPLRFRGRRHQQYSNVEANTIKVIGKCILHDKD